MATTACSSTSGRRVSDSSSTSISRWRRPTAAETDRIEDAVDYRDVVASVVEVWDARAYTLLEALASALADALLDRFPLVRVRVRVRKPDVELERPVDHAAVVVERLRV